MKPIHQPPAGMSGHDLAEHLFAKGGVAALVRHARGRPRGETDWLEFKASTWLLPEDLDKGDTQKDQNWHIAKGIIALMNTSGGALVIGIREKVWESVPLDANDPKGRCIGDNLDDYIRKAIMPQVWPGKLSWTTPKGETMTLERKPELDTLLDWRHGPYKNADGREGEVIVVLVKPSAELCLATTLIGTKGRERSLSVLYRRLRSDGGEVVEETDFRKIEEWKANRQIEKPYYAGLCEEFDRESGEAGERRKVNGKIAAYYRELEEKARKTMAAFTPLDAEENIFGQSDSDAFYSPEAEEIEEGDDDWLRWDEEDNEDWREDAEAAPATEQDGEGLDNGRDGEAGEDDGKEIASGRGRELRKGNLLELLEQESRAMVSGEPGGGKTTCLTYYALQFAREKCDNPTLAVFIRMGQWRRAGSLEGMMAAATGLDAIQLEQLARENRLRLVIDAVNECPDRFRAAAIVNIGSYLEDHPQVPAVVSTRHPRELSRLKLAGFRVQPMDETHRRRYLARYLGDEQQAEDLLEQIDGMPGGNTIAENPMLLRLVVEVFRESGGRGLPRGRAGLYRRSLASWYKREKQKAERAGTPFSVGRKESLGLLAELAFRGREKGFRDIPMEEATAIWGDVAERYLDELCQGPIVFRDGEDIHFRHETFQEYLCAEHLLAHPEDLPRWGNEDYAQWGMVFAYVEELSELEKRPFPKSFQEAAWKLNPWLGVALGTEIHKRHQNDIYRDAVFGRLDSKTLHRAMLDREHPWYRRRDAALRYMVSVSGKCHDNWRRMEQRQLACLEGVGVQDAIALAQNWLVLGKPRETFQYHAPQAWDTWIAAATPDTAVSMLESGLAEDKDFWEKREDWIKRASLYDACRLASCGMCRAEDFKDKIAAWIAVSTPNMARGMISCGLAQPVDFRGRLDVWLRHSQYAFVRRYPAWDSNESMLQKIREHVPQWVQRASVKSAQCLIQDGFASARDFQNILPSWLAALDNTRLWEDGAVRWLRQAGLLDGKTEEAIVGTAREIDQACRLIRERKQKPNDYLEAIPRWIEHATIALVRSMVQHGLGSLGDFAERINDWIASATPEMALALTKPFVLLEPLSGTDSSKKGYSQKKCVLAKAGNFTERTPFWRGGLSPQAARILAEIGVLGETEIAAAREVWRATVSPGTLLDATRLKCFSWPEAMELYALWGAETLPAPWNKLAPHFTRADDSEQRNTPPSGETQWNRPTEGPSVKGIVESTPGNEQISVRVGMLRCIPGLLESSGYWHPIAVADGVLQHGQEVKASIVSVRSTVERGEKRWEIRLGIKQPEKPWKEIAARYLEGIRVHGKVVNLVPYGAFVQLEEGVNGFVHGSELSWARHEIRASDYLKIGDEVEALVLKVNAEKKKIVLSMRQLQPNPWIGIAAKYPAGSLVRGKVVNLLPYGAFVQLEEGIEGLVHGSEISWFQYEVRASEYMKIGDEVEALVLDIDEEAQKMVLSMRRTKPNPWGDIKPRYPTGTHIHGKIVNFLSCGAFVQFDGEIAGLVHNNEISWNKRFIRAQDVLNLGDEVEAVVLDVNAERQIISLSIRQAKANPWEKVQEKYSVGSRVKGKIINFTNFGAFIELEEGVDGMIHLADMSWTTKLNHPSEIFKKGDEVESVVLSIAPEKQYISLGYKQLTPCPYWEGLPSCYHILHHVHGKVREMTSFGALIDLDEGVEGELYLNQISGGATETNSVLVNPGQIIEAHIIEINPEERKIGLELNS